MCETDVREGLNESNIRGPGGGERDGREMQSRHE